jgi:ribonuclease III family protein
MIRLFLRKLLIRLRRPSSRDGEMSSDPVPGQPSQAPRQRTGARSPLTLAYVGDAVYELYVRVHLVEQEGMTRNFQPAATGLVRAAIQSQILGALEPQLTDEERNVVRRGRNASIGQIPKSASMIDYRRATALECLLGHLLLDGENDRLMELLWMAVEEGRKR